MKRILTSLAVSCTLLLATCNEDEPLKLDKITLDSVEVVCGVLPSGFYSSVCMVTPLTGYTITTAGKIFKTTDGGNSWIQQVSGTTLILHDIFFLDEMTGYIAGGGSNQGIILKTTDGGASWQAQHFSVVSLLTSIHFINESVGFCVGFFILLKTTDGGESWSEIEAAKDYRMNDVSFFDEKIGLISARPSSLRTTDGGLTWKELSNKNILGDIQIMDSQTAYVWDGAVFYKTTNKGDKWIPFKTSLAMNSFYFINEFQAVAVGYRYYGEIPSGLVYVTNDGGKKWDETRVSGFYQLSGLSLISDSTAIAIGQTGPGCVLKLEFSNK